MSTKPRIALAMLIAALLAVGPLVAGCSGEETTTTPAAVTTTAPPATMSALDADRTSKLNEFLRQLEQNNKAMGGVVITRDGEVVYEKYVGFTSLGDPNNQLTKFRIGSTTKMFTATMILQLVEEGRLTLDTKLAAFYPQVQNSAEITISEMLSHRSGIHNFTDDPEIEQYAYTGQSKEQMVARIAGFKPDFQPDEEFSYSNSNYVLLGYIIEAATGSTYQKELKDRILDRVGLSSTKYGGRIDTEANEAGPYAVQDGQWIVQRQSDMSVPGGAGGIISTPRDLAAFITALFNNKLMTPGSLNTMLETKDGFGRGIFPMPVGDHTGYGHTGNIDTFLSALAYYPDEKVGIAIVANGLDGSFEDVCRGVSRICFNLPFEVPDFAVLEHLPTPTVPGTLAFAKSVGEGNADIYVVDTDGSGLRPVTATSERWEDHPSWSPDGKRIVYTTAIPGDALIDTLTVEVANNDGSERARLGDGKYWFPTWSPDGKHIVLAGVVPKESTWLSLFVVNPDGSGAKDLFDAEVLPFPSWAPNGDILFLRGPEYVRGWDLYSMKPDGSATVRLTTGKDIGGYALSPDGKTLAYYDRGEKAIITMPLGAGGPSVTLLETAWLIQYAPFVALSWSPDGRAIAFASSSLEDAGGSPLYIVNADGSGLSQVPGIDNAYDPAWRPR